MQQASYPPPTLLCLRISMLHGYFTQHTCMHTSLESRPWLMRLQQRIRAKTSLLVASCLL